MKNIIFILSLFVFNHHALMAMKRAHSGDENQSNKKAKTETYSELYERPKSGGRRLIAKEDFIVSNLVARGHFSDVYFGTLKGVNSPVAIKIFKLQSLPPHLITEFDNYEKIANLARTNHFVREHFVAYLGICDKPGHFSLLMELMPSNLRVFYEGKSSLFSGITQYKQVSEEDYNFLLAQIARALDYLHEKGIGHKHLKSTNIFVRWDAQEEQWRAKISDHGLQSLHCDATSNGAARSSEATVRWRAPFTFSREFAKIRDTLPAMKDGDHYSFAIVAWEVAVKHIPFADLDEPSVVKLRMGETDGNEILLADLEKSDFSEASKKIIKYLLANKFDSLEQSAQDFENLALPHLDARRRQREEAELAAIEKMQDGNERQNIEELEREKEHEIKRQIIIQKDLDNCWKTYSKELASFENELDSSKAHWDEEIRKAQIALDDERKRWHEREQQMLEAIAAKKEHCKEEQCEINAEIEAFFIRWNHKSNSIKAKYSSHYDPEDHLAKKQKALTESFLSNVLNSEKNKSIVPYDVYVIIDFNLKDLDSISFSMVNTWFNAASKKLAFENQGKRPTSSVGVPNNILLWELDKEIDPAFDISDKDSKKCTMIPLKYNIDSGGNESVLVTHFFVLDTILYDILDQNSLITLSQLNKYHNQIIKLISKKKLESYLKYRPQNYFGKKQWEERANYQFIENDPCDPPLFLDRVMQQLDVDTPGKTVGDRYVLVLIPKGLEIYDFLTRICEQTDDDFLLDQSLCGMKNRPEEREQYAKINCKSIFNLVNKPNQRSHFVLVSDEYFAESLKVLRYRYDVFGRYSKEKNNILHPTALQAAVASWAYFQLKGEHIMKPGTGTFTQDFYQNGPLELRMIVGFVEEEDAAKEKKTVLKLRLSDKGYVSGVVGSLSIWQPKSVTNKKILG